MIDTVCIIQSKNMRKIDSVLIGFILIINIILTASKPHVITKRNGYKGLNELATDFLEIQIRETESYDHILRALSATKLKLTSPSVSVSDVNNIVRMIDVFQRFSNYRQSIQSDLVNLARRVDQMKDEDEVTKLFNRIVKRMKCLKSITSCLNLDVIAKRLSSPTLEKVIDTVNSLQPDIDRFASSLTECEEQHQWHHNNVNKNYHSDSPINQRPV